MARIKLIAKSVGSRGAQPSVLTERIGPNQRLENIWISRLLVKVSESKRVKQDQWVYAFYESLIFVYLW